MKELFVFFFINFCSGNIENIILVLSKMFIVYIYDVLEIVLNLEL